MKEACSVFQNGLSSWFHVPVPRSEFEVGGEFSTPVVSQKMTRIPIGRHRERGTWNRNVEPVSVFHNAL
jgi:hypothetical protein